MPTPPPALPRRRRVLRPALLPASLSLLLALSGCGDDAVSDADRPALTVETVAAEEREITRALPASGAIGAWQEVIIGTELTGLRIASIEADVGDTVRRGETLAQLERGTLQSELAQAEAQRAEAVAAAAEARANADRARALAGRSALSAREVDQLLTASVAADTRVEGAEAQLANARRRLGWATVKAPDDGVIAARNATPGAMVVSGSELFRLIRKGRIEWRAEVPERDYAEVRAGMGVVVQPLDAEPVRGEVRTVSPGLDPGTRRGIVYVDLPATPALRPGMFVSGAIELGRTTGRVIPLSAVTTRDGSHYVFVVDDDRRVRELKVSLGVTVNDSVEVTDGLPSAAVVVKSGGAFLRDGDLVALAGG
jgi:HlyD family secretion protein